MKNREIQIEICSRFWMINGESGYDAMTSRRILDILSPPTRIVRAGPEVPSGCRFNQFLVFDELGLFMIEEMPSQNLRELTVNLALGVDEPIMTKNVFAGEFNLGGIFPRGGMNISDVIPLSNLNFRSFIGGVFSAQCNLTHVSLKPTAANSDVLGAVSIGISIR